MTLIAATAGAAIALVGQYLTRRGDSSVRRSELVLEQCSQLVSLSEDFRNRLWEERELGQAGRVDGWDLAAYRLAAARLTILCRHQPLLSALHEMSEAGKRLGAYWRRGHTEPDELELRYEQYKTAIQAFVEQSGTFVRPRLGRF